MKMKTSPDKATPTQDSMLHNTIDFQPHFKLITVKTLKVVTIYISLDEGINSTKQHTPNYLKTHLLTHKPQATVLTCLHNHIT